MALVSSDRYPADYAWNTPSIGFAMTGAYPLGTQSLDIIISLLDSDS